MKCGAMTGAAHDQFCSHEHGDRLRSVMASRQEPCRKGFAEATQSMLLA